MFRFFANWYAKLSYRWELEVGAGKSELNANLSAHNANDKRKHVEQVNRVADDIEKNITLVAAEEEERKKGEDYLKLTAQEKYEERTNCMQIPPDLAIPVERGRVGERR
jgi:hypothetical protein